VESLIHIVHFRPEYRLIHTGLMITRVIISIMGAYVGEVRRVRPHAFGAFIWLAEVNLGDGAPPVQIVFGGDRRLERGELVPVAPPGAQAKTIGPGMRVRWKKMRARSYRGERSHGMLCSLDELGWMRGGPNEVPVLRDVEPGECLDDLPTARRPEVVAEWKWAKLVEAEARAEAVRSLTARNHRHLQAGSRSLYQLTAGSHQTSPRLVVH
jgi:tRNA-binding EMAP/Myf-like protein